MRITVKKNKKVIIERNDVFSVKDKGGAYEITYDNYTAQAVFKADDVVLEVCEWGRLNKIINI